MNTIDKLSPPVLRLDDTEALRARLQLSMIAAVDANSAIGYQGDLLVRLKADLRRFRDLTWGQRIIYGRKTLATFPKGQALPGRENVVLSRGMRSCETLKVCDSLEALFAYLLAVDELVAAEAVPDVQDNFATQAATALKAASAVQDNSATRADVPLQAATLAEAATAMQAARTGVKNIVIGGTSLYQALYPYTDTLELTEIQHAFPAADSYFPDFRADFELVAESEMQLDEASNLEYVYRTYKRKK